MPSISSAGGPGATPSAMPKIYTINGPSSTSSATLPTWITTKPRTKSSAKRQRTQHTLGQLELIQDFTFPQAANRIKTTPDGLYAVGTGTYKPMIKVWDLEGLTEKFTRVTEAENVDFVMLSTDWTKSLHLQADRSVSVHTQGGLHHSLRLPMYGRCVAYHSPSCEALVGCTGAQVHRLNLEEGRFMTPLTVGGGRKDLEGINCVDVNPRHGLWALGLDGVTTRQIEFWDPRSRSTLTALSLPSAALLPTGGAGSAGAAVGITALASHPSDGLSLAVGTSTGHTLLYDVRSPAPFATKDQGYGEAVKQVAWLSGDGGEGKVLSADTKVVKVWNKQDVGRLVNRCRMTPPLTARSSLARQPSSNVFSLHPPAPLTSIHAIPGTGLLLASTDSPALSTYYVPDLGPAPRWASFLDGITEELEDEPGAGKGAYSDFKFVDRKELDVCVSPRVAETAESGRIRAHAFPPRPTVSASRTSSAHLRSSPTCTATFSRSSCTRPRDSSPTRRRTPSTEPRRLQTGSTSRRARASAPSATASRSTRRWPSACGSPRSARRRKRPRSASGWAGRSTAKARATPATARRRRSSRTRGSRSSGRIPTSRSTRRAENLGCSTQPRRTTMWVAWARMRVEETDHGLYHQAKRKKTAVEEEDEESDRMSSDGISQSGSESKSDEDDEASDASDDDQAIGGSVESEDEDEEQVDSDEEGGE